MNKRKSTFYQDAANVVRGVLMGGADVIPGVSGGTVALIVGIYQRLVTAISHVDLTLWEHLSRRRWREAAAHIDLRFLGGLGCGICLGILALGGSMHTLLDETTKLHILSAELLTRPLALAAFFGAIVASSVLVARMIQVRSFANAALSIALVFVGAAIAFWLTGLDVLGEVHGTPSYLYVFVCGAVAICAMILPGISGAYILVILGLYHYLTGILKALPRGGVNGPALLLVIVFAAGCAVGLVSFSKALRWLMARYQPQTMSVLCGFMVGSLRKIWPFEGLPSTLNTQVTGCLALGIVAAALVLALDWYTQGSD